MSIPLIIVTKAQTKQPQNESSIAFISVALFLVLQLCVLKQAACYRVTKIGSKAT